MKHFSALLLFFFTCSFAYSQITPDIPRQPGVPDTTTLPGAHVAQARLVRGVVQNASNRLTLPGATVLLQKASDASNVTGAITDADGNFRFERVAAGDYLIRIDYIGFKPFALAVQVQQKTVNLGVLALQEAATAIGEVVVVGKIPPAEQKGDTTQFNAAAFKTAPDATTQDLVQKMPGITIEDGQLQAQGEAVQRILIDGKPFFGTDVDAALQNLPAQVVANIQVFDKRSDKAELSGFDDGERIRTINIITKPEARKGQFGRVTGGYGTDKAYMAGAGINFFKNDRRLTLTGLSNNVNLLSFSADPENNGESDTQNGIIKSNVLGLNYTNNWFEKLELAGSYSYTNRNTNSRQDRFADYVQSNYEGQQETARSVRNVTRGDHRFNLRLDYELDENNRIRMRTRGNTSRSSSNTYHFSQSIFDEGPLSQFTSNTDNDNTGLNLNNNLVYSHRFAKPGRSLNLSLENSFSNSDGETYQAAELISYLNTDENTAGSIQNINGTGKGYSWETEVSYTEPVGKYGQLELEYEAGNRVNKNEQETLIKDRPEDDYRPFGLLSNSFSSEYISHEAELGYRYNNERLFVQVENKYQVAKLTNEQLSPGTFQLNGTYTAFLPSARLRYRFTDSKNLEFNYDTRTHTPSLYQLQEVIDISNPLRIRVGNAGLEQSFQNWFRTRYRSNNPDTNQSFYASVTATFENNMIVNSTTDAAGSPYLSDDVDLVTGAQLIRPENLDGYRELRTYLSFGQPIDFIQSNLNLNASVNYNRRPGMVFDQLNYSNTRRYRIGASISSNISERIDFNISSRSSYSIVGNSVGNQQDNTFFAQHTRLWYNWIFGNGFIYRTNINHTYNAGLAQGFNNSSVLWNMSIGKRLFAKQLGEVSISVYDLLKQNINIRRNISSYYVEDVSSNVLQRYFMLTFTYNIRNFGGGSSLEDFRGGDRGRD